MSNYVVMPKKDWQDILDATRAVSGHTGLLLSSQVSSLILNAGGGSTNTTTVNIYNSLTGNLMRSFRGEFDTPYIRVSVSSDNISTFEFGDHSDTDGSYTNGFDNANESTSGKQYYKSYAGLSILNDNDTDDTGDIPLNTSVEIEPGKDYNYYLLYDGERVTIDGKKYWVPNYNITFDDMQNNDLISGITSGIYCFVFKGDYILCPTNDETFYPSDTGFPLVDFGNNDYTTKTCIAFECDYLANMYVTDIGNTWEKAINNAQYNSPTDNKFNEFYIQDNKVYLDFDGKAIIIKNLDGSYVAPSDVVVSCSYYTAEEAKATITFSIDDQGPYQVPVGTTWSQFIAVGGGYDEGTIYYGEDYNNTRYLCNATEGRIVLNSQDCFVEIDSEIVADSYYTANPSRFTFFTIDGTNCVAIAEDTWENFTTYSNGYYTTEQLGEKYPDIPPFILEHDEYIHVWWNEETAPCVTDAYGIVVVRDQIIMAGNYWCAKLSIDDTYVAWTVSEHSGGPSWQQFVSYYSKLDITIEDSTDPDSYIVSKTDPTRYVRDIYGNKVMQRDDAELRPYYLLNDPPSIGDVTFKISFSTGRSDFYDRTVTVPAGTKWSEWCTEQNEISGYPDGDLWVKQSDYRIGYAIGGSIYASWDAVIKPGIYTYNEYIASDDLDTVTNLIVLSADDDHIESLISYEENPELSLYDPEGHGTTGIMFGQARSGHICSGAGEQYFIGFSNDKDGSVDYTSRLYETGGTYTVYVYRNDDITNDYDDVCHHDTMENVRYEYSSSDGGMHHVICNVCGETIVTQVCDGNPCSQCGGSW